MMSLAPPGKGSREANRLAEVVEIEVDGDRVALRGIHVNGCGSGGKVFDGKIELESGAGDLATAFIGAEEIRMAGRRERLELLVFAGNLNVKIFPKVIGTRDEAVGRAGTCTGGSNDVCRIRISELDLHDDSYELGLIAMIECRLLGAVVELLAGLLNEKSERSEYSDGGDVRTGFWRGQDFCVFVEEGGHGFIVALAEE